MTGYSTAIQAHAAEATKFWDSEVSPELIEEAATYLTKYTGTFSYLTDMQRNMRRRGALSIPQWRGVLNCMVAQCKKDAPAPTAQTATPAEPVHINDGWYTVVLDDETRRTIRVNHGHDEAAGMQFVSYLSGSNNERDYTCCGTIKEGVYKWTHRHASNTAQTPLGQAVRYLLSATYERRSEFGRMYALESVRCYVCNRLLTDPVSIATGVGPVCRENNGIEAIQPTAYTATV